jgi:hypothetical protein
MFLPAGWLGHTQYQQPAFGANTDVWVNGMLAAVGERQLFVLDDLLRGGA